MKILSISGKNLASLGAEFCVDFEQEPLASAGLFAISGPTGAGKSTLFDALCLALYGATPRMLKTRGGSMVPDVGSDSVSQEDPRNLLRRGAAEGYAQVDFVGTDTHAYRARWTVRRARNKAAGSLQDAAMTLHRLPEMTPLGGTRTETANETARRIGLSFEQFTRAVLLAQNEFSAFLKTEENERGAMLEALTGSTIYSTLSRRAFERHKLEQQALKDLRGRLADKAPLDGETRAALVNDANDADVLLTGVDARKAVLEQQLRWREQARKLRDGEAQALAALAACDVQRAEAEPRRRYLATVDAVEPARALTAEVQRLDADHTSTQAAQRAAAEQLLAAVAHKAQASASAQEASKRLVAADASEREAKPQLDQAKALDAILVALAPTHANATAARDAARAASAAAQTAAQEKLDHISATRIDEQAGATWLLAHASWQARASQWPRWDKLFTQAQAAAQHASSSTQALADAQARMQTLTDAHAAATLQSQAADTHAQQADAARDQANKNLAAFDTAQVHAQRAALALRRDQLASGERLWNELSAAQLRCDQTGAQARQIDASAAAAAALMADAVAAEPVLAAAVVQAERSQQAAELACADSVIDLRATLIDDAPCPVCGSADHPYHEQDGRLAAMLATLREEVARCRQALQQNLSTRTTQQTLIDAAARQREALAADIETYQAALARGTQEWAAHPLSKAAPQDDRHAWFSDAQTTLRESLRALEAQELAEREARARRDAAQLACDTAAASRERLREQARAAHDALAGARAQTDMLTERVSQSASTLAALLADLDAADLGEGWQAQWQADAARFHAARAADAADWQAQSAAQTKRTALLATLTVEHTAANAHATQAAAQLEQAEAEWARIDAAVNAARNERNAMWQGVWQGEAVATIEAALTAATHSARAALTQAQAAGEQATRAEARATEALAQCDARLVTLHASRSAAQAAVQSWIDQFAANHLELDPLPDAAALHTLLAIDAQWRSTERHALHTLDAAHAQAAAVLTERRNQLALHLADSTDAADITDADLADAFTALQTERRRAHDRVTELRLALAQDDANRQQAQAIVADIEQQQATTLRWGRLDELIGSADGKKFRNYAQQFTLDVLLGYANSHLGQLARRYRLERIVGVAGPSLGLLVRDQDMGGEIRSVNSLSGGESFLVSLALALGLASLSSNRVKVESLFIDEGFGSLDSETLRVAMDALDGLQAMGRKVGVISHVQEMTERIATRIVVQPNGGGSSSVTVQ